MGQAAPSDLGMPGVRRGFEIAVERQPRPRCQWNLDMVVGPQQSTGSQSAKWQRELNRNSLIA